MWNVFPIPNLTRLWAWAFVQVVQQDSYKKAFEVYRFEPDSPCQQHNSSSPCSQIASWNSSILRCFRTFWFAFDSQVLSLHSRAFVVKFAFEFETEPPQNVAQSSRTVQFGQSKPPHFQSPRQHFTDSSGCHCARGDFKVWLILKIELSKIDFTSQRLGNERVAKRTRSRERELEDEKRLRNSN